MSTTAWAWLLTSIIILGIVVWVAYALHDYAQWVERGRKP